MERMPLRRPRAFGACGRPLNASVSGRSRATSPLPCDDTCVCGSRAARCCSDSHSLERSKWSRKSCIAATLGFVSLSGFLVICYSTDACVYICIGWDFSLARWNMLGHCCTRTIEPNQSFALLAPDVRVPKRGAVRSTWQLYLGLGRHACNRFAIYRTGRTVGGSRWICVSTPCMGQKRPLTTRWSGPGRKLYTPPMRVPTRGS